MKAFAPVVAVASLIAAGAAEPALAHHSYAMFNSTKSVTLEGTVKEFEWTNPHSWVQLTVADPSGKSVEYSIETGSPNGLSRQGWSRNSAKPGDKAVIVIHPLKNGPYGGSLVSLQINGQLVGNEVPH